MHWFMEDFTVRPFSYGDEEEITQLLQLVFNGWPHRDLKFTPLEYWRWKYQDNVLDTKFIVLAEFNRRIIGAIHSVLLRIKIFDEVILAVLGGDVAVHPDFRKIGVWNRILETVNGMRKKVGVKYLYNVTTNPIVIRNFMRTREFTLFPCKIVNLVRIRDIDRQLRMIPVENPWVKKIGFHTVKSLNKIGNALRGNKTVKPDVKIYEISSFDDRIDIFWDEISEHYDYIVERRRDYLNWRYCDPRGGDFVVKQAEGGDRILGYSVLRINRYRKEYPVGYVVDLLTLHDRPDVVDELVSDAIHYFDVHDINLINYQVVKGNLNERIFKKHGFLDSRVDINLFYNHLGHEEILNKINQLAIDKIHVCWGDQDALPVRTFSQR